MKGQHGQDTQQYIRVEVVLAMPDRQELVTLEVEAGTTLAGAITLSGLPERFEGFELDLSSVGIFGKKPVRSRFWLRVTGWRFTGP